MLFSKAPSHRQTDTSQNAIERRVCCDRRECHDRRSEPRFGDIQERRCISERRQALPPVRFKWLAIFKTR